MGPMCAELQGGGPQKPFLDAGAVEPLQKLLPHCLHFFKGFCVASPSCNVSCGVFRHLVDHHVPRLSRRVVVHGGLRHDNRHDIPVLPGASRHSRSLQNRLLWVCGWGWVGGVGTWVGGVGTWVGGCGMCGCGQVCGVGVWV